MIGALAGEPAHQANWARGAQAEREIACRLEHLTTGKAILLHHRHKPGSTGNIDHIAIGPAGVFVIDAKRYKGEIGTVRSGVLVRPAQTHLVIKGRDQSALLEGVLSQARCVEGVLARGRLEDVPVWPILCFLGGEFQLLTRAARGVALCGPKRAAKVIQSDGPLDEEARLRITRLLAERLRPAVG